VLVAYTVALTEREAHRRLARYRVRSEWFMVCAEVVEVISKWCWVDVSALAEIRRALQSNGGDVA
jgi:hypothetical protein